jgi:hypothetical protein
VDADEEGLVLEPRDILKAFELAGPYATGKSNTAKLENRWELALAIIDRALMECDRGLRLLELTNEVNDLRKRIAFVGVPDPDNDRDYWW